MTERTHSGGGNMMIMLAFATRTPSFRVSYFFISVIEIKFYISILIYSFSFFRPLLIGVSVIFFICCVFWFDWVDSYLWTSLYWQQGGTPHLNYNHREYEILAIIIISIVQKSRSSVNAITRSFSPNEMNATVACSLQIGRGSSMKRFIASGSV